MIFLHLLAEERPFPANNKKMVDWGGGEIRASKEAAWNNKAHFENIRTPSPRATAKGSLCYRGSVLVFYNLISWVSSLKFGW